MWRLELRSLLKSINDMLNFWQKTQNRRHRRKRMRIAPQAEAKNMDPSTILPWPVPAPFPDAFEVVGDVDDFSGFLKAPAIAGRPSYGPGLKTWVRFFNVDPDGEQVGPDAFCSAFDAIDFLIFISSPRKYRRVIERNSDLSRDEEDSITKILRGKRGNIHPLESALRKRGNL
jgi:hypothetical protein